MGRSVALTNLDRATEAAEDARQALGVAREIGYRTGEVLALGVLSFAAMGAEDPDGAVRAARQAARITTGVPGVFVRWTRYVLTGALIAAGDLAAADEVCAAALVPAREAGAWQDLVDLLMHMVMLDLRPAAPRTPPPTSAKPSRLPYGTATPVTCSAAWTAAECCAP